MASVKPHPPVASRQETVPRASTSRRVIVIHARAVLVLLEGLSNPGGVFSASVGAHVIGLLTVAVRIALGCMWFITVATHLRNKRRDAWISLSMSLSLIVVLSAITTRWPLHARFAASRSSFERTARDFGAHSSSHGGYDAMQGKIIGVYYVVSAIRHRGAAQVRFYVGGLPFSSDGFLYDPECIGHNGCQESLGQGWWTFQESQ